MMLYTMLAGQPPFQAGLANADPATISGTQLIFPEKPLISQQARDLITALARYAAGVLCIRAQHCTCM